MPLKPLHTYAELNLLAFFAFIQFYSAQPYKGQKVYICTLDNKILPIYN